MTVPDLTDAPGRPTTAGDPDALVGLLSDEQAAWLAAACGEVAADPGSAVGHLARAGRAVGRTPLDPGADPAGVLHGTLDDAARARLVVALAGALPADGESLATRLTETYQRGDTSERRGVLRGLDALALAGKPSGTLPPAVVRAGTTLAADALRANDQSLVAAAVGPFAAAHLDDHAWRHAVLKLVFMGVSLDAVAGLDERADDELARMARDFAAERRAAGRVVPDDVARIAPELTPAAPTSLANHSKDA
ncbi:MULTISPECIES: EboA domain-containing protein [Oerskovia]|uniref:EboA domain-containing protein n=1 Tax=Oerskovia gallyi TaxID=2762226 RepID=A0ABR8UZC1_9CELL|nr:EboA domain-containing protein [Oerskovia gallyi]MBD7997884.1 EboA domain-containing protein [Oerskovia gallyi]